MIFLWLIFCLLDNLTCVVEQQIWNLATSDYSSINPIHKGILVDSFKAHIVGTSTCNMVRVCFLACCSTAILFGKHQFAYIQCRIRCSHHKPSNGLPPSLSISLVMSEDIDSMNVLPVLPFPQCTWWGKLPLFIFDE